MAVWSNENASFGRVLALTHNVIRLFACGTIISLIELCLQALVQMSFFTKLILGGGELMAGCDSAKPIKTGIRPLRCLILARCFIHSCFCLLPAGVLLGQNSPATLPNVRISSGGFVFAIAVQNDGKVIIGGSFTSVNGVARTNLARINAN